MKRMLQSFTSDRLILGLAALLLSAYALIGNHVWGEVQSTTERARSNEKAITAISKDVEQINSTIKGLDQRLSEFLKREDRQEEADRLERLLQTLERNLRRAPAESTPPPRQP